MKIISRKEAKEQGLKFYFTGLLCKYSHVSLRYTSCCVCAECREIYIYKNRERVREAKRLCYQKKKEIYLERNRIARKKNIERYREKQRIWRKNNRDRINECQKKFEKNNPEKIKKYNIAWRVNNPEKYKKGFRRENKKSVQDLRDGYIRHLILRDEKIDIPDCLIDLKRQIIINHRLIHEHRFTDLYDQKY